MANKKVGCIALACLTLTFSSCWEKKEQPVVETPYEKPLPTDEEIVLQRDTLLFGVLGEETGMSSLQLLTDEGDTLSIMKSAPDGYEGRMLGDARNYTDRITLTARISGEGDLYLISFLNVSQLENLWKNDELSMDLKSDKTVEGQGTNYHKWRVEGNKLLLTGEHAAEYGQTARIDTAIVEYMDDDSLFLSIPRHGDLRLGR